MQTQVFADITIEIANICVDYFSLFYSLSYAMLTVIIAVKIVMQLDVLKFKEIGKYFHKNLRKWESHVNKGEKSCTSANITMLSIFYKQTLRSSPR